MSIPTGIAFDPALNERLSADIRHFRTRRAAFSVLSVFVILCEIATSGAVLVATLEYDHQTALIFSAISTFVLTLDAALGVRERASTNHAVLTQLRGVRDQMLNPKTSPLWDDYALARSYTKINYLDAALDACTWQVAAPSV